MPKINWRETYPQSLFPAIFRYNVAIQEIADANKIGPSARSFAMSRYNKVRAMTKKALDKRRDELFGVGL